MDLQQKLLLWLHEEITSSQATVVPIHYLQVRLAIEMRGEKPGVDMTQSTVLSLDTYDRALLLQSLRSLTQQGYVEFANEAGIAIEGTCATPSPGGGFLSKLSESKKEPEFIMLTELGMEAAARLVNQKKR